MFIHVYFRLNEELIRAGHNPYQWNYSSWMPYHGLENPFLWVIRGLVNLFLMGASQLTKAYAVNLLASASLLSLLTWSAYFFFALIGRSPLASCLGAIIVSFTGFHLTGVRLFNHLYLQSFAAVGPVLLAFIKMQEGERIIRWVAVAAMAIGFSLLSGTNAPLFYYLPFLLLLPLLDWALQKDVHRALKLFGAYVLSIFLGVLVGAPTVLPGLWYLGETNRSGLSFSDYTFSISFKEQIYSLFFRDWWWTHKAQYYESDCFLGVSVISLAVLGIYYLWKNKTERKSMKTLLFSLLLVLAFIILNLRDLPSIFSYPFSFFNWLSIRNPSRFFILALYPLAFFSAYALDHYKQEKSFIPFIIVAIIQLILVQVALVPTWNILLPDTQIAALVSLAFSFVSMGTFLLRRYEKLGVFCIFATFFFAPIQLTSYPSLYLEKPSLIQAQSPHRLKVPSLLGLNPKYSIMANQLESILIRPPSSLENEETKQGRIWDEVDLKVSRFNFFAPQTGHHFAFSALQDPASPLSIKQLSMITTEPILDLYGVCWRMSYPDRRVLQRKTCLPEAFLVPGWKAFQTSEEVLLWMKSVTREDFQKTLALNCKEQDCSSLMPSNETSVKPVKWVTQKPGEIRIEAESQGPAFLFLSTVFHRGWEATVNGSKVPILKANHAFMAIPIPGKADVKLTLSHKVSYIAYGLSLLSFLGLLFVLLPKPRSYKAFKWAYS